MFRCLRLDVGVKDAFISKNSQARENRVKELTSEGNPKTVDDVLGIMGDTKASRFPIWRTGRYPDIWATMSLGMCSCNDAVKKTKSLSSVRARSHGVVGDNIRR